MCGINGIINYDNKPVDRELLVTMRDALFHRGPDDAGIWINGNIGLAHRRLSIIDLTEAGRQPMCNEDRTLWLVFNGEIYNYIELRGQLEKKDHVFSSHTDAEVILHAYEEFGEDCVRHFNGMWAFAIWDIKENKLFASRDRFGEKPFYYYESAGSFYFASEIKAFFAIPSFKKRINQKTVFLYLVYNYVDAEEDTFFEGVKQLLPAHSLIAKEGSLKTFRYWDLDNSRAIKYKDDRDYFSDFRHIFTEAVKIRLRSDVEVGTSLSGGLDSTAIVSVIKNIELKDKSMVSPKGYSVVFPGFYDDESKWIDIVSRDLGVRIFFVTPRPDDFFQDLRQLILCQEEPFFKPNVYLQWKIMRMAKENQTAVLLDGQGADEIMAGYPNYFAIFWAELLSGFKLFTLARELIRYFQKHEFDYSILVMHTKSLFSNNILEGILRKRYAFIRKELLNKYIAEGFIDRSRKFGSLLKDFLYLSLTRTSLSYLLHYADRNSMAFSREIRLPFLDHRLVEFMFAIPGNLFIKEGEAKYILRRALGDIMPREITVRQGKVGYVFPAESWFGEKMKTLLEGYIENIDKHNAFFIQDKLRDYVRGCLRIKNYFNSREAWKIINLLAWEKVVFRDEDI